MRNAFRLPIPATIGRRINRRGPALFLGLALAGFATACTGALASNEASEEPVVTRASASTAPLVCEVALDAVPGGTRIGGRVTSADAVRGSYAMQITSRTGGGRTSISQGGDFSARAGETVELGETELYGSPASHAVDLTVTVGGRRYSCSDAAL